MNKTMGVAVCAGLLAASAHGQTMLFATGRAMGSPAIETFGIDYTADFAGGNFSIDGFASNGVITSGGAALGGGSTGAAYENGRYFVSNVQTGNGLFTGSVNLGSGVFTSISDQGRTPGLGIPGEPTSPVGDARALGSNSVINAVVGLTTESLQYAFDATTGNAAAPNIATIVPPRIEGTAFASNRDTGYTVAQSPGQAGAVLTSFVDPLGNGGGPFLSSFTLGFLPAIGRNFGMAYDDDRDLILISSASHDGLTDLWAIEALPGGGIGQFALLGTIQGFSIDGLAYVPAPGGALAFGLVGIAAARRRR